MIVLASQTQAMSAEGRQSAQSWVARSVVPQDRQVAVQPFGVTWVASHRPQAGQ